MLFQTKINNQEGYIYFLFEHKSYKDKFLALQVLSYMLEIWKEDKLRVNNKLPIILPIIIYHGESRWTNCNNLTELIESYPKDFSKFIPDYDFLFYDLTRFTDKEIQGIIELRVFLIIYRDIFIKDQKEFLETLSKAMALFKKLESQKKVTEYFETFMRYIFDVNQLDNKDFKEVVKKISSKYPEGGKKIMTLADQLREEGKREGKLEGKIEGKIEGKKEIILSLLESGMKEKDIAEKTGIDLERILKIEKEIKN